MRGYIIAIIGSDSKAGLPARQDAQTCKYMQLVDFTNTKQRVITRSSFAAELRNALDAAHDAIVAAGLLHELMQGTQNPMHMVELKEAGKFCLPVVLFIDAQAVFNAACHDDDSSSSDKSMVYHVKALRHLLVTGQVKAIVWIDTRDMLADALTKGKICRDELNKAFNTGIWQLQHPYKVWSFHKFSSVALGL